MVGKRSEISTKFDARNPAGDRLNTTRVSAQARIILVAIPTASLAENGRGDQSQTLRHGWLLLFALWLTTVGVHAQDGTWTPGSSDWNTAANWAPSTAVPTGIAAFGSAATTTITFSGSASVGTLQFNAGAPAYSFNLATSSVFNITGTGIINNSSNAATFTTSNGGALQFLNSSTAGSAILTTGSSGITSFENTSTGGQARAITNTGGIFDISGLTSGGMTIGSIEGAGKYELGSNVLTVGNTLSTIVSGNIVDAGSFPGVGGGLIKVGTSTLTLSGVDTYTGSTVISAGTLKAGSTTGFSSSSAFTDNAVLDLAGFSNTVASLAGSGSVTNSGGTLATLTAGGNGTSTLLNGNLTNGGTSSLGLTKTGAGTMILAGVDTYSGGTLVSAGTLQAGSTTGFSLTSAFTVNSVLDLAGFSNSVGSLAGNGSVTNSGGNSATLTAGGNATNTVFSGTLADGTSALGLSKTGAGTMTLTGSNGYSGGTVISAGTLQIGNGGASGSIVGDVTDNGSLAFNQTGSVTFPGIISGTGILKQLGTGALILTAANTYSGGTTISAGTLQIGNGGTSGSIVGNVTDNASIAFNQTGSVTFGGLISGTGTLKQLGTGTLILTAANTYTGGTTISAGTLQIGNGGSTGSIAASVANSGNLVYNRSGSLTLSGVISGPGTLTENGPGTLVLSGTNTYTGATSVSAGTLEVDGTLANTPVTVQSGATLSGQGTIVGAVNIQNGGILAPGPGTKTLTLGPLLLNASSMLNYQLGTPGVIGSGVNGYVKVNGDLTLDGVLNVTKSAGFGSGSYELINYTGALTNLTLSLGTLPSGFSASNVTVTTSVAGQVNLVVNVSGDAAQLWDGSTASFDGVVHGGTGTWDNSTTNFIDGAVTTNQAWQGGFAVFTAGTATNTVTLGDNIAFQGVQFASNGYTVTGGGFTLQPTGTALLISNSGVTATIAAPIVGPGGLNKEGLGVVTLSGLNTYSGGTTMSQGILSVTNDTNLGALSVGLTFNGGELLAGNTFSSARAVGITSSGGTLATVAGGDATFSGNFTNSGGSGPFTIGDSGNTGMVSLSGTNTYTGSTTVVTGATLQALSTAAMSSSSAFVVNGTLDLAGFSSQIGSLAGAGAGIVTNTGSVGTVLTAGVNNTSTTFSGVAQNGTGGLSLTKIGAGTLTLTGINTYTGGTMINGGTLQIGSAGLTGSIVGDVIDNGTLAFSRSNALTFGGIVSGTGTLSQIGSGTLTLTGANLYQGGTLVSGTSSLSGTLSVDNDAELGSTTGGITLQGGELLTTGAGFTTARGVVVNTVVSVPDTLAAATGTAATYTGVVSGAGALVIGDATHTGAVVFTGSNSYLGGTTISAGTLQIGNGGTSGSITGNVVDNGNLIFNRTDGVTFAGTVSGAGALSQIGTGTLTLTATETYTGTTTISAGTLQLGSGGTTGSIVGNVLDNGNLAFNHSNAVTFAGLVSGAGSLSQTGPGTLTLTNVANTYSGGTFVSAGILSINNNAELGSASGGITLQGGELLTTTNGFSTARTVDVSPSGTLAATTGTTATYSGLISDTGALVIGDGTHAGLIVFTGNNTYSGGTTISAGTLQIGNGGTIGNIVGNVIDNAALAFDHSDTVIFAGAISGTGTLSQIGSGVLTLSGANTYGGVTTISAGTLQIGNGATTGSIVGNVTDNANLTFNRSDNITFGGNVSGAGSLNQIGPGTLALTGANTYSGGTVISGGGTIAATSDNNLGTGSLTFNGGTLEELLSFTSSKAVTVNPGGGTFLTPGGSFTLNGVIAGPGGLTFSGSGQVNLLGNNTYAGGTTISAGEILGIGNGGMTGSIVGNVVDNGTLSFNRADPVIYSGNISGAGDVTVQGTVTFTGTNTDNGTTTIIGTLQLGLGGTSGSIVGSVVDKGSLIFNRSDAPIFSGNISGAGNVTQTGVGTTILTGSSSYTGQTTISFGTLQIGNGGTIGSIGAAAGPVVNNGNLAFDRSDIPPPFSENVSGTGRLSQIGSGTVILTGTDTYSGGTIISAGTLQIGNGATAGSIGGNVTDNANLAFNRSDAITFSGPVSGSGSLNQMGPGTLILTGVNTYSGGTVVSGGTLSVDVNAELGALTGGITLQGSELLTSSNAFSTARTVDLRASSGPDMLAAATGTAGTYTGVLSDAGTLEIGDATNEGTVVLTGNNTYTGGTTLAAGVLSVAADSNLGASSGGLTLDGGELLTTADGFTTGRALDISSVGTLAAATGTRATYTGVLSDTGALVVGNGTNTGTVVLTGNNTYSGGTTISSGTLQIGDGAASGTIVGNVVNNASLAVNSSSNVPLAGAITGSGTLSQVGSGKLTLTGTSTYTGATTVSAGTLEVDGALGNTAVSVQSGAVLSGQGTIAGSVTILNSGHLAPGGQTLGVGNLFLNPGSILDYQLSTAGVIGSGVNSLVNVTGNLTLGGVLNITNGGNFGSGSYRLMNYSGALSDPPLELGTLPTGFSAANVLISNATSGQINMLVSAANSPSQFWDGSTTTFDGTIHGGSGTWDNVTTNFTDEVTSNSSWQGGVAVFSGAAGTVTLGDDILFQGMDFTVDGYSVLGAGAFALHPVGTALITTESGVGAVISAPIVGLGGLNKAGAGTLTLSGANTYTGGTTVSAGVLSVGSDSNLGDVSSEVTLAGGELLTSANGFSTSRTIDLSPGPGAGTLAASNGTTATYTGVVSDTGTLAIGDATNAGTVVLSGVNTYSGGTDFNGGVLAVMSDSNLGTGSLTFNGGSLEALAAGGGVTSNKAITLNTGGGTFLADAGTSSTLSGAINGPGGLTMSGTGTLTLSGTNGYTGGTNLNGGIVAVSNDLNLGTGPLSFNSGALEALGTFASSKEITLNAGGGLILGTGIGLTLNGVITGTGGLTLNAASSQLVLAGNNLYAGGTLVTAGTLQIGNQGTSGSILGNVVDNGAVAFARADNITFGGVLSGTGTVSQQGAGTLVLTGANRYSGGTVVSAGTLSVDTDGELGNPSGGITLEGGELLTSANGFSTARNIDLGPTGGMDTLAAVTGTSALYTGILSDSGPLVIGDTDHAGTVVLVGTNTFSGGTTIAAGTLQIGNGSTTGAIVGNVTDNGQLAFNRSDVVAFSGNVTGTGGLTQIGPGTLALTGANSYTGATNVSAGTLEVDGSLGNTSVTVQGAAVLSGSGTIVGGVTILNGGHLTPGPVAETLGVGNLVLNSGSILDYTLSTPGVVGSGVNTLVNVSGNLTLAGILNVTNGGNFGSGAYRLMNYSGTLTNDTLGLGTLPAGFSPADVFVTTGVAGQVNLVVSAAGEAAQFWDGSTTTFDGTVHGGSGTWNNFATNFTDAGVTVNQSWENGVAIFSTAPGTVTLGDNILFQGMQFTFDGYTIAGAGAFALEPTGTAIINTLPGVTATISAPIAGPGGLNKAGIGLLSLTGTNTYSGGTTVSGGVLQVGSDANLGDVSGGLTLDGGELVAGNGFSSFRPVLVTTNNGTLAAAAAGVADFEGNITGPGSLTVGDGVNTGTVDLSGTNSYLGTTTIVSGATLRALSTGALSTTSAFTVGGTLDLNGFSNQIGSLTGGGKVTNSGPTAAVLTAGGDNTTTTFSGILQDGTASLGLTKTGTGALFLTGANTYTGGTTINAGSVLIGDGGITGSIAGNVLDNGNLAFNRQDSVTFAGNVSGTGVLLQLGPGTLTLTGDNTYSGGTMVGFGSTLQVDADTELGAPGGGITLGGGELVTTGAGFSTARTIDLNPAGSDIIAAATGTTATYTGVISDSELLTVGDGTHGGTVVLAGNNSYTGGTTVAGGVLSVANDANLGNPSGGLTLAGGELETTANFTTARTVSLSTPGVDSLFAAVGTTANYQGILSGAGALNVAGPGTVVLTALNTYGGGTTISAGTLQIGNGGTTGEIVGNVVDNGNLAFDRSDAVTFSGNVSGSGTLNQNGSDTLILTGTSTYTGATVVSAGTLEVDGVLGNTAVSVQDGAILAGQGTIGGSLTIQDGGHLAPGPGAQTLRVGSLFLNPTSILDYRLGAPGVIGSGVNTLVNVAGNLTLDGILNVSNAGGFASGAYRLINYSGALSDLTLDLGTLPAGFTPANVKVTTAVAGQVNLVVSTAGAPAQFWDGANTVFDGTVDGGSGTWDNFATNFTNGTAAPNQSWQNGVAIFIATPGTVTLGDNILFQGMQFSSDGYTVAGAGAFVLQPTGTAIITTDPGVTATISAPIAGPGGLNKAGLGVLSLTGANSYAGGTTVSGGILSVGNDANLGDVSGGLTLDGGELVATGSGFTTFRPVAITSNNGILAAAAGGSADFQGNITGSGSLAIGDVVNTGIVDFSGTNSYLGATTIVSGTTLKALSTGALSPDSAFAVTGALDLNGFSNQIGSLAGAGLVTNNGSTGAVLTAGGDNSSTTFSGVLEDGNSSLGLTKVGTGTLTLLTASTYSGGTTVSAGTLQIGAGGTSGSIAGDVTDNGSLVFDRSDDVKFSGIVSGIGRLTQSGPGTLTLTGTNTYQGGTTVSGGGAVNVGSDANLGAPSGGINLNGGELATTADFASARTITLTPSLSGANILGAALNTTAIFSGAISGAGGLSVGDGDDPGTVVLTNIHNSYAGGTTVGPGAILSVSQNAALGDLTGEITLDDGELLGTGNFATGRSITLTVNNGVLAAATGNDASFVGNITGSGSLTIGDAVNTGTATLGGTNTYTGATNISSGATLAAASTGALSPTSAFTVSGTLDLGGFSDQIGSLAGTGVVTNGSVGGVLNPAVLTVGNDNTSTTFGGLVEDGSKTLGLTKIGSGTLTLTGADTYTDGTVITAGILQIGNGGSTGSIAGDVIDNTALVVNRSGSVTLAGAITGAGTLSQVGSGTLILAGTSSYAGATTVSAGTLEVDGVLENTAVTVQSLATLAGQGTITGNVTIEDGGHLAPGPGAQTLSVGSLVLNPDSILDYQLSTPGVIGSGVNSLVNVAGNLTLAGVLNVTNGGSFGSGSYRLLNYAGTLADLTLSLGTLPAGFSGANVAVVTGVAGQVNLVVNSVGAPTQFWDGSTTVNDGTVHGGSGTWINFVTNNFTNFAITVNQAWQNGLAIFTAAPGTVTLGSDILFQGMQFSTDGYTIAGAGAFALHPTGNATITTDAASVTATIAAPIVGAGGLNKAGPGVLILTGENTYNGGTTISGGVLRVASDTNLGAPNVGLELNGGELETSADFTTPRAIALIASPNGANTLGAATSTTATYTGVISGAGGLTVGTVTDSGTVALTNLNNTYAGGTTVSGASLSVAIDANLGDVSGGLVLDGGELVATGNGLTTFRPVLLTANNGTLAAEAAGLADFQGNITGVGSLAVGDVVNTGIVEFSGANTYLGSTTIVSGSTLRALSVSALSSESAFTVTGTLDLNGFSNRIGSLAGTGTVTNDGLAEAVLTAGEDNTSTTFSGVMQNGTHSLGLTKDGTGTLILTGANTYSGGTSVTAGTLVAAGNGALGSGFVDLLNDGTLVIQAGVTVPNPVTFVSGGVLENAGTLNNDVSGNPSSPATIINSGTINGNVHLGGAIATVHLFTGSKITGSLGLSATNSTLILDGAGQQLLSLAVGESLTNNGLLIKDGSGSWTIDRPLDAPLGTDIQEGTLVVDAVLTTSQVSVAAGAILQLNAGGSVGNLVDDGSLIFAGSATVTYGAVISGTGNVIQDGPGTTILSGKNTYTGGTVINLGTLVVNNAQALGIGNVIVNGGVLAADRQPINVSGNYTQNAGGTLQLSIAGRAPGQFDVLNVAGNAALNGTLRLLNVRYQPQGGDKLTLVNTGGVVTGRFAQFQNPFAFTDGFNTVDVLYARDSVILEFLELNGPPGVVTTTDFASFALTPNERAAANLLDAVQLDPRAANLISFLNKEPFADLPADFNKISPDGLTALYEIGFSNANIQRLNLEGRLDDVRSGSNGFSSNMKVNGATVNLQDRTDADGKSSEAVVEPILQHTPENRWGVWMTGFGDFVSVDADSNAKGYDFTTGGVSLGLDYRLTAHLVIGVMGEYSHTWTALKPRGHIDVDSGRGGLYATWYDHGVYLNGAIYGGHNNDDSGRSGLQGLANGSTEGSEWGAFLSGGYDFHVGHLTAGPIASLQYTSVNVESFSENGSLAPMQIHTDSVESLRSDLGFRAFFQWQIGTILIEPSLKATWEHEYKYSGIPIAAGFAGIPGPSSTFSGPAEGHDSAVVSAGISVQWTPTILTYLNYDGQLGRGNYDSNGVTGGVKISF